MAKNVPDFRERAEASANAKKALIERVKAKAAADSGSVAAKLDQRRVVGEARDARRAARKDEKDATAARQAAQRAAELAAEKAALEEARTREQATQEQAAAEDAVLKAKQKAERDARYAKRKARR